MHAGSELKAASGMHAESELKADEVVNAQTNTHLHMMISCNKFQAI